MRVQAKSWEDVSNILLQEGRTIKEDAVAGNTHAQDVMKYYGMAHSCPGDHFAKELVCEAYCRYENSKKGMRLDG